MELREQRVEYLGQSHSFTYKQQSSQNIPNTQLIINYILKVHFNTLFK